MHAQLMKTSVRFQAAGVAMIYSDVQEKDIIFFSSLRKTRQCQMIKNEGGKVISGNMFITKRSRHFPTETQECWYDFQATPKL